MKDCIKRFITIFKGELKYVPKREFATSIDNDKANYIDKRGDIEKYTRKNLKMVYGGNNR
jgi:hypothetical protein